VRLGRPQLLNNGGSLYQEISSVGSRSSLMESLPPMLGTLPYPSLPSRLNRPDICSLVCEVSKKA